MFPTLELLRRSRTKQSLPPYKSSETPMSSGMLLNSHNRLGLIEPFSTEILGSGRPGRFVLEICIGLISPVDVPRMRLPSHRTSSGVSCLP
jgi:hypothetical protein